jgi:hypothetical protein
MTKPTLQTEFDAKNAQMDKVRQFDEAPDGALFDQKIVAAKLDVSTALLEKLRWTGGGVPFVKLGRAVKYRKTDVLEFIEARVCRSTSTPITAF